jgi:Ca2+-binding EF-hand superfamily protein
LDKLEFEEMLSKLGIFMTTQELTAVYNQFDKNHDGQISYDEFINTVRTDMNEKRLAVVKHAW